MSTLRERRIFTIIFSLLLLLNGLAAQQMRGPSSYASPSAYNLMNMNAMSTGSQSSAFVNGVGGVSFDQTALPAEDLQISALNLEYLAEAEDGERLVVHLNGETLTTEIYDWQLVPAAKYADSPYYSCFTLFGSLKNEALQNALQKIMEDSDDKRDVRILNYHPDLENTLLGLRIYQMDVLTLYEDMADLFKEGDAYILGVGESAPDVTQNTDAFIRFNNLYFDINNELGYRPRSWVVTDFTRNITFQERDGCLEISGTPYYFMWRFKMDVPGYNINQTANTFHTQIQDSLAGLQNTDGFDQRDWLIRKFLRAAGQYEKYHNFFSAGLVVNILQFDDFESRYAEADRYALNNIYDDLIQTLAYMDARTVIHLEEWGKRISDRTEILRGINPAVWDASVTLMRYAAFFRYCKTYYPGDWTQFLQLLSEVKVHPEVVTPTLRYPKGDQEIESLLSTGVHKSLNAPHRPPEQFRLIPGFPNPFNPHTTLGFEMLRDASVGIQIYNIIGQVVEGRHYGILEKGRYAVRWQPDHLPAGVYVAVFRTNQNLQTQKLTLQDGSGPGAGLGSIRAL